MPRSKAIAFTLDSDIELEVTATVTSGYVNNRSGGFEEPCGPEVEDLLVELVFGHTRLDVTKLLHERDIDAIVEHALREAQHD